VRFFIDQGISANRLVAAGFGEYQPLDSGSDEIAFRRNRRIELKLTER
jgi:chemotaxis protein MotB